MTNGSVHNKGFTLVELLTVMAIVTLLLAVAMPVLMQAHNHARSATCISNLKQLGAGVALYTQDWNDHLPVLTSTAFAGSFHTNSYPEGSSATEIRTLLASRVPGGGVFRCPNDTGTDEFGFSDPDKPSAVLTGSSYLPWHNARTGSYGMAVNGVIIGSIPKPSACVLFRDYGSDWHGIRFRSGMSVSSIQHSNAVYADGHTGRNTVCMARTNRGCYSWLATKTGGGGGNLRLNGAIAGARVEMTGMYASGQNEIHVEVSGVIWGEGPPYELDRTFTMNSESGLEQAMNRVITWVESLAG